MTQFWTSHVDYAGRLQPWRHALFCRDAAGSTRAFSQHLMDASRRSGQAAHLLFLYPYLPPSSPHATSKPTCPLYLHARRLPGLLVAFATASGTRDTRTGTSGSRAVALLHFSSAQNSCYGLRLQGYADTFSPLAFLCVGWCAITRYEIPCAHVLLL